MTVTSDLDAWWETQRFDIEVDRALLAIHWCRVNDRGHICDATLGQVALARSAQ